jgi:putative transposase
VIDPMVPANDVGVNVLLIFDQLVTLPRRLIRVELESGPQRKDQTMKRKRFTEEQIIGILKEHDLGAKAADLCRKHGISEATFYNWKSKFGGMDVSEAKRLKQLQDENGKLKKLLADAMLDNAALKDLLSKKW